MDKAENDKLNVKLLNKWLIGMVIFVVLWSTMVLIKIDKHPSKDYGPATGGIPTLTVSTDVTSKYTNFFPSLMVSDIIAKSSNVGKPLFIRKHSYEIKEFVVIDHFFIKGFIIGKQGLEYKILYQDRNRALQTISLPSEMLLSPSSPESLFLLVE